MRRRRDELGGVQRRVARSEEEPGPTARERLHHEQDLVAGSALAARLDARAVRAHIDDVDQGTLCNGGGDGLVHHIAQARPALPLQAFQDLGDVGVEGDGGSHAPHLVGLLVRHVHHDVTVCAS